MYTLREFFSDLFKFTLTAMAIYVVGYWTWMLIAWLISLFVGVEVEMERTMIWEGLKHI